MSVLPKCTRQKEGVRDLSLCVRQSRLCLVQMKAKELFLLGILHMRKKEILFLLNLSSASCHDKCQFQREHFAQAQFFFPLQDEDLLFLRICHFQIHLSLQFSSCQLFLNIPEILFRFLFCSNGLLQLFLGALVREI